jgi:hypothetical protein
VFLLMPFLTTDWTSWEQRLLAAAARQHGPALAAAAGWVQDSPRWLQDLVVSLMLQDGGEPHAAESLRAALNQRGCLNNWHMAAQEFRWVGRRQNWVCNTLSVAFDAGRQAGWCCASVHRMLRHQQAQTRPQLLRLLQAA